MSAELTQLIHCEEQLRELKSERDFLEQKIKDALRIIEEDEDLNAIGACIKVASILRRVSS